MLALTKPELKELEMEQGNQEAAVASAMHKLFIVASMLVSDKSQLVESAKQVAGTEMTFGEFTEEVSVELQCFILAMAYRAATGALDQTIFAMITAMKDTKTGVIKCRTDCRRSGKRLTKFKLDVFSDHALESTNPIEEAPIPDEDLRPLCD